MDKLEQMIADALRLRNIKFTTDFGGGNPSNLDFNLVDYGIEIEVKQFHTPRISDQMARAENVICAQGKDAVAFLARCIAKGAPSV